MAEDFKKGDRVAIGKEPMQYEIVEYGKIVCKLKPDSAVGSTQYTFASTSKLVKIGGTAPQPKPVEEKK